MEYSQSFDTWIREADQLLHARTGVARADIADQPWRDWWADQMTPREAVRLAMTNEGFVQ
ncbi:hypothetical protein [Mycolicibacterium sp.]|uniref:hypothetical protein n=1 Tax=Mycolicibacterium sp. TaxID=2320850 RepID=UPI0037C5CF27